MPEGAKKKKKKKTKYLFSKSLWQSRSHPHLCFSLRTTTDFYLSLACPLGTNSSPAARQCPQSEDRADTPGAIFSCFFNLTVTHCLTSLRFYQLLLPWKTKQILSHFRSQIPLVPSNLGHLCSYKIPCLVLTSALQHPRPAPSPPTPPHLLH